MSSTGYGKPPRSGRFKKGRSGNPAGRPKGRKNKTIPHQELFEQTTIVTENGVARHVTYAQAFVLSLAKAAAEGDVSALQCYEAIQEEMDELRAPYEQIPVFNICSCQPGSIAQAAAHLGIGKLLNSRSDNKAQLKLESWIISMALARLGDQRLSEEEQRTVIAAVRLPKKVSWPDWWTIMPE